MHTPPNHTPAAKSHKTPTPGHLIRLQRPVSALGTLAPVVAGFRKGTKFGEDAHEQLFAALHIQLAIDAPHVGVDGVWREPEPRGGVLLGIAVEHGAHDAAFARREAEAVGERAPLARNEHGLAGSRCKSPSHDVPICCALRSHRQTGPSSGSTTVPMCTKPHFVRTRVDAFASGRVCARMRFTRGSPVAKWISARAASVAYPRPSREGTTP